MAEPNWPGWRIELNQAEEDEDPYVSYMLWAPREGRAQWGASWDRRNGHVGDFRYGDSAAEALDCFPDDAEGRGARALLLQEAQQ
jgi:hypothetical protein